MQDTAALCAILVAGVAAIAWVLQLLRNWCRTRFVHELLSELREFENEDNVPLTESEVVLRQAAVRAIARKIAWRYGGPWFCKPALSSELTRRQPTKCAFCKECVEPKAGIGLCPNIDCIIWEAIFSTEYAKAGS